MSTQPAFGLWRALAVIVLVLVGVVELVLRLVVLLLLTISIVGLVVVLEIGDNAFTSSKAFELAGWLIP